MEPESRIDSVDFHTGIMRFPEPDDKRQTTMASGNRLRYRRISWNLMP